MFRRQPETWFGIACLLVAAAGASWKPHSTAQLLAFVLAGATIRFLTLPGRIEAPDRRSGGLLAVPFVVGFCLFGLGLLTEGKSHEGPLTKWCGVGLLAAWAVLAAWEAWRNRRAPDPTLG